MVIRRTMSEPIPDDERPLTTPTEPQVDDKYNNSEADIALISRDGVLFHVESFYLKANSTVFRDMMTTASNSRPEPLPVEAPTAALRLFLDFIVGTELIKIQDLTKLKDAMQLAEKFDCLLVKHAMLLHLHSHLSLAPWTAFCIAAECSNLPLAKAAIRQMGKESNPPPNSQWDLEGMTGHFAKQCGDTGYLVGFLRATTKHHTSANEHIGNRQYAIRHKYDWGAAADCFGPA